MTCSRVLAFGLALFSAACNGDTNVSSILPQRCRERPCPTIDEGASADDYVILLDGATALVTWDANGRTADAALRGGVVVVHASDPECLASSDHPCSVTLKQLRLELGSLTVPTTDGDVELEQIVMSMAGPLDLLDEGSGYVAEAGTELQSCMLVDGVKDSATTMLASRLELNLDFANESLGLTGSLPVRFHWGEWECSTLDLTVTVVSAGAGPWSNPER